MFDHKIVKLSVGEHSAKKLRPPDRCCILSCWSHSMISAQVRLGYNKKASNAAIQCNSEVDISKLL